MLNILWTLASFIVALGILVAVHEWGHFIVARKCGVKVEKFSIGFGKALWKRKDKLGTEFVIAAIPLGGFVRMLDERVDVVEESMRPYAFNHQPVWKRIAIIAAGPVTNFVFAVFALCLMYMIGIQAIKPIVGSVENESIAAKGGLEQGMQITAVDGTETMDWQSVNLELVSHIGGDRISLQVLPPDASTSISRNLDIQQWNFDPDKASTLKSLGIIPYRPEIKTELARVEAKSPAEQAGLLIGDKIVGIDGTKMENWGQIVSYIGKRPSTEMEVLVNRQGTGRTFIVKSGERRIGTNVVGYMGISPVAPQWPENYVFMNQFGLFGAFSKGMSETWRLMTLSVQMIGKLLTGDVSVKNLSGPISIAQGAGASASYGFVYFLSFLALISVNLGIVNLLPLPVLDGGHLLFYTIEMIIGRPVPEKYQDIGFRVGGALLFTLMAIAIFNDIARL